MIYKAIYAKNALNQLKKFDKGVAKRILNKVRFYLDQDNPMQYAQKLQHPAFGEYRFRIGDYRVIFDVDKTGTIAILQILSIKHRKDIYKNL